MKSLIMALALATCVATTANGAVTIPEDAWNPAVATKPARKPAEKLAALAKPMPAPAPAPAPQPTAKPVKTGEAAPTDKPMSAWRRAYIAKHHHEPPVKAN